MTVRSTWQRRATLLALVALVIYGVSVSAHLVQTDAGYSLDHGIPFLGADWLTLSWQQLPTPSPDWLPDRPPPLSSSASRISHDAPRGPPA